MQCRSALHHHALVRLRHSEQVNPAPDYPRNRVAGGTHVSTVNLLDRSRPLCIERIDPLPPAMRWVRETRPFHIRAWVVLSEHMHALWTLPEADAGYRGRWQASKMLFSQGTRPGEANSSSR